MKILFIQNWNFEHWIDESNDERDDWIWRILESELMEREKRINNYPIVINLKLFSLNEFVHTEAPRRWSEEISRFENGCCVSFS